MKTKWIIYQELELISHAEPNLRENITIGMRLGKIWRTLIAAIALKPEVQVWQTGERADNTCWNTYDPATGKSTNLGSEQEVRTWLEQS